MNHAIVYLTKTGHSKKIAEAIAESLSTSALDIKTRPEVGEVDLLFIVGGLYGKRSDPMMLEFVKGLSPKKIKKAVLVTSSAAGDLKQSAVRAELSNRGIAVDSKEFCCKGSFLFFYLGHPNQEEIEKAVAFSKSFLKKE
ncbi:MAG TPA: flavodoxin domain-containing protein [Thermotogota bacterium]|jgi:flavodoxin|nr:flavodoxin [Thermotogota bacterium]NLZ14452.1 flavodoxin [Thermotogaceae bacterium]MDD8040881.1 flavodoxin domain-containing protein [Thermotogota bacterium]MDD8053611.1 flavodoxin domain-containing protein [Thermotogota bacterium]HNR63272.1 flavodoxin domain-containing protein [Thermotogota bacterium]